MANRWTEDLAAWVSSLRASGSTLLIVALVVAGALILSPSLTTFVQQQREIAELRESVRVHREAVTDIDAERAKWNDPVYVRSQARDRLYYVMPGETQLSVIDNVVIPAESTEDTSATLTRIDRNWAGSLVASVLGAGTATPETAEDAAVTDEAADADSEEPANEESAE
ncbi:MAG: FtsB family cell division protein [Leucobacter sp.]